MVDPSKVATPADMRALVTGTRSDDPWWFSYDDQELEPADLTRILGPRITDARKARIEEVLTQRISSLVVVIEGMVDVGNVAAVMRTADGFGIQQFHTIDTAGDYKRSRRTTQGADKWIDRYRWETTPECYRHLHTDGYTIVATTLADDAIPYDAYDWTSPTAVVFGNELDGLTKEAVAGADVRVKIPMRGFTESFNISVAAAVTLSHAVRTRVEANGSAGDLDVAARDRLRAVWYAKSVPNVRSFVRHSLANPDGQPSNGMR